MCALCMLSPCFRYKSERPCSVCDFHHTTQYHLHCIELQLFVSLCVSFFFKHSISFLISIWMCRSLPAVVTGTLWSAQCAYIAQANGNIKGHTFAPLSDNRQNCYCCCCCRSWKVLGFCFLSSKLCILHWAYHSSSSSKTNSPNTLSDRAGALCTIRKLWFMCECSGYKKDDWYLNRTKKEKNWTLGSFKIPTAVADHTHTQIYHR